MAVVLKLRDERETAACVDSLEQQGYPELAVSVVAANAVNAGMQRALDAAADYVLLVRGDTVLEPGCIRELVRVAELHGDAGAVGPKVLRYDAPDRIWFGGGKFDRLRAMGRHERKHFVDLDPAERQVLEATYLAGCCLLIPAATLRSVGDFRDDFFDDPADAEYGLRIMRSGQRLLYAPAARVRHRVAPRGTLPSVQQIRVGARNRRRLVRQYYSPRDAALFAIWFYPSQAALMLTYIVRGEAERARAIWRGLGDG
jgi:GT2 family glycosyltransferase